MTKVEQGILINSQHLYNVLNNIPEEVSLKDKLAGIGYDSIEQFFEEKAVYEMQNELKGKTYEVHMKEFVPFLYSLIQNQESGIISIYTDETCVCHGTNSEKPLNEEYCQEHNIPIYPYNSFGGNIVASEGDYGLVFVMPKAIDMTEDYITEKFAAILSKYIENIKIQGNDILADGKKIVGSGSFGNEQIFLMLFYFSTSDKSELIHNICGEPMTDKQPGYINQKDLPISLLKEELLSWLQGL